MYYLSCEVAVVIVTCFQFLQNSHIAFYNDIASKQLVKMSRGEKICRLALQTQQSTNVELIPKTVYDKENKLRVHGLESKIPTPIISMQEVSNENSKPVTPTISTHEVSNEYAKPVISTISTQEISNENENANGHTVASCSSSSSSSSSSCSSSGSSESSSEDCEDTINDISYTPKNDETDSEEDSDEPIEKNSASDITSFSSICNTTSNLNTNVSPTQDIPILVTPPKKGVKRRRNTANWKRNVFKKLRNSGEAYETHTRIKNIRGKREMKGPCREKCKLQCPSKFTQEERQQLFSVYWSLGEIEKQRQFINNCMTAIVTKYRYTRVGGTRKPRENNNAFYFNKNGQKVRVCKVFFTNTLDINDRTVRTVQEKRNKVADVLLEPDQRGKHGKHKKLDPAIREGIRQHINTIPKIESHYTRANTTRTFIDGSRSLADIHRDYVSNCKSNNKPYGSYAIFQRLFTDEFNISFFIPKKDLCETCVAYQNADNEEKENLKEKHDLHLVEKNLSREEKKRDKENSNFNGIVAVYDLQAVMQIPKGDVSVFYYKSKLNVLNFTIYDLKTNCCECYLWDESNAHRGVNELGTCVLKYLQKKATMPDAEIIFYSDNCVGQQKNKFMLALYLYAVRCLGIKSITHKFLIKGHTQNEGDSAHSLIERQVKRQLRSGPIYTPDGFIAAIKAAKKQGEPLSVNELCYEDFYDLKDLASIIGPMNMTNLKLHDVKVLRVERESPTSAFYKNSYSDEFQEVTIIKRKKQVNDSKLVLKPAFYTKPGLAEKKKIDLLDLVNKNHIPKYYGNFYKNL